MLCFESLSFLFFTLKTIKINVKKVSNEIYQTTRRDGALQGLYNIDFTRIYTLLIIDTK